MDGKVTTVGQIIKEKRAISPLDTKVLYHEMQDKPTAEDSFFFILKEKPDCKVLFRPENVPVKPEQKGADGHVNLAYSSVAGCLPTSCWQNNLATEILWSVKWTARGLTPVRPNICLKEPCKIQAGHAIAFQSVDA